MDEVPLPSPQQPAPHSAEPLATPAAGSTSAPGVTPEQLAALLARPLICTRCHAPVRLEYYFCPNCGAKLTDPPLGSGLVDQLLLFAFSLVLPWIAYLAITKWQGIKYLRAPDARSKQIGLIALVLLVLSSIVTFWLVSVWTQELIQNLSGSISSQVGSYGGI